ncbi:MAG TPA: FtsX-like permease family protein, partial [Puia sp.]|nr:FtsX-like permease family protein [Puia sp.]
MGKFFSATYLLAKPGVTSHDIDKMLAATVTKYVAAQLQNEMHSSLTDMAKKGDYWKFYSIPLTRIHLYSNVTGEFEPNGNIQHVYIFMIIAVFLLLIACSNFMNLSTARSADRSREVGVRKVLGASRENLMGQFLTESILTSFIALLLAILIAALLLPYFNQLSGKHIVLTVLGKKWIACALLVSPLIVGLLAGSYPALYLSVFQPIQVLKGRLSTGFKSSRLRNSLIVFQFSAAIALIIGTLVIYNQLGYIRSRDLGFNRDQVLTIHNTNTLSIEAKAFKEDVEKLPGISGGTMTSDLPNKTYYDSRGYFNNVTAKASETVLLGSWKIEANYIPLLGMKVIRGRNFSPAMPTDSSCVLINETGVRLLGYTDPINKSLYTGPNPVKEFRILGVVKDFNAGTLHNKIEPIVFHLAADSRAVSFRINTRNIPRLIAQIKERYQSMGGQAFTYSFMDDDFNKLYLSDERTGKIFFSFAL